jgi:hypothetical protein
MLNPLSKLVCNHSDLCLSSVDNWRCNGINFSGECRSRKLACFVYLDLYKVCGQDSFDIIVRIKEIEEGMYGFSKFVDFSN